MFGVSALLTNAHACFTKTIVQTILISTHYSLKNVLANSINITAANMMCISSINIYFSQNRKQCFFKNFPGEIPMKKFMLNKVAGF